MKIFEIANGRDARPTDPKSVLEQRLIDLEAVVRLRQKDWLAARAAAAAQPQDNLADIITRERAARTVLEQELAARRAQYDKDIARNHAVRAMVDEQLCEAGAEVKRAREAEASAAAAVERLARAEAEAIARLAAREAEFASELSAVTETRDGLEQQLSYVESALASARQRHELATREVDQLTEREAELSAQYALETATRATLERRLAEVETALADASAQITRERAVTAEREAQFQTEVASIASMRDSLEQQLRAIETALSQQIDARLALERAIADQRSAAADAERRFLADIAALTENARAQRADLEDQLSRERNDHQAQLADRQQQHRSAMATAATRLAEREAQFKTELEAIIATRDGLEQQLRGIEARLTEESEAREALEQAIADLRSTAADAGHRFRAEISAITENASAERARLEDQVSRERRDHQALRADEQQQHRSAMATAAARLAEREAQFQTEVESITATRDRLEQQLRGIETALSEQIDARLALERAVAEQRSAATEAEQRFRDEIGAITEKASAEQARLEDQVWRERRDHQALRANEEQQHRSAMAIAAARLAEREAQFQAEVSSITVTRDSLEQQLRAIEAALSQQIDARLALERAIAEQRSAATDAEHRFRDEIRAITEHAGAERARLENQLSRERTLGAERLAARGAEFEAELERLSGIHANALARFQASLVERDAQMEQQARASAALQARLDASEAENRRQFEQTPVPLVRLTRDGEVEHANYAFADLVGCRTPGELRDGKSAAMLFESRNDLAWLIDRSANAMKTGSVETTCLRTDGVRLAVRLSARPAAAGVVEIAAENLTPVRVLEDRLREAHRMEAVGRVASEIAMTCERLLRDVYREAQRLLTTMTGGDGQRDHAVTLLDDVTLAGSILHQLVAYGDEQAAALAPVDVNGILRDLQPVLKQVAGDAITLELRKHSSPVHVEVNAERVERLLVNVASYGRQRMPHGGRLRIELATAVVDGKFTAQHPNVRQGPHALITVTEVARPAADGQVSDRPDETKPALASGRSRVELGALQELISECGGHLWITAEPGGSMVVRMRLPLRAAWQRQANARARQGLGRMTARLLGR